MYCPFFHCFLDSTLSSELFSLSLHDALPISVAGVLIRIPVSGIPITGRSTQGVRLIRLQGEEEVATVAKIMDEEDEDRKSTRLNSSHVAISYAVFCLTKK